MTECKCGHSKEEHWGDTSQGQESKHDGDCLHWENNKYCSCSKFEEK